MVTNPQFQHELTSAREALLLGNCAVARAYAGRGLKDALTRGDRHSQAVASLLLGKAFTLESKMQWGHRFATNAQVLFAEVEDHVGRSECLFTLSYVASALGQNDEALRAASHAVAIAREIDRGQAAGLNYLGVASFWMRNYGRAGEVLDVACNLAVEETGSVAATFQPLTNACFTEMLRANDSLMGGHRFDFSELERRTAQSWELVQHGMTGNLMSWGAEQGMFLLEFVSCFLASKTGRNDKADTHYLGCLERAAKLPQSSWMRALVWWARLERAKAAGDLKEAAVSVTRMVALTDASPHVPMKALAKVLHADIRTQLRGWTIAYAGRGTA